MAERKELAPEEAAELGRLWRKLVKLFHPDRFASDPVQQATYEKLTAAINHAKDHGDLVTLRKIAEDPQGFILRQGWASLDFADTEQLAQLRRLWVLLLRSCAGGLMNTLAEEFAHRIRPERSGVSIPFDIRI